MHHDCLAMSKALLIYSEPEDESLRFTKMIEGRDAPASVWNALLCVRDAQGDAQCTLDESSSVLKRICGGKYQTKRCIQTTYELGRKSRVRRTDRDGDDATDPAVIGVFRIC